MTKEKILDKFQFEFAVMLERSLYSDKELEKVYKFISQSLDQYAKFVVREIMPESRTLKLEGSQAYDIGWNECVNEAIDTAKDKFNIDI